MGPFYLIYHPHRKKTKVGNLTVYHDDFDGNEDPYLWNKNYLHTFCHITQLSNNVEQVNFWVSGYPTFKNFTVLLCDCVFHIKEKIYWSDSNKINLNDPLVDNEQTFEHHYKWANSQYKYHHLTKRRRYTFKANPKTSFQPQDGKGNLINILSFLNKIGLNTESLIESFKAGVGSRPYKLDDKIGQKMYQYLADNAKVKLYGKDLAKKHPNRNKINLNPSESCC